MSELLFVTIVYNNEIDTLDFIESIKSFSNKNLSIECIIVDNSDDASIQKNIDKIPDLYSFIKVIRPPKNMGYFGGFNFFFENYFTFTGKVVILCNNDLIFSNDFAEILKSKKYSEDIFVVCPDVVTLDGFHQNPHVLKPRTKIQRLKLDIYFLNYYIAYGLRILKNFIEFILKIKKTPKSIVAGYLHMGIGACYVLLPSFFGKFRALEYPHFLYGEEAYLTRQVHQEGGRLYFDPALKVKHKESATLSRLPKKITYEYGRDGYWNYRKFY